MAEHGAPAAGEHGSKLAGALGRHRVADEVDAAVKGM
jgi:hypothetical protein